MQTIHSLEALKAVIEGGIVYLEKSFYREQILCHPLAPITFIPSDLDIIPADVEKGIAGGWMLIYSIDGLSWTYNFKEVLHHAMSNDGHFYISDWQLEVFLEVDYYMIKEVVVLLTRVYEEFTLIQGYKWKPAELGTIQKFSLKEYFSN
ncbi:hypothetical protein NIE88_09725 [Sporolactobacillus shoreicorticis]|uniref:Uncharacterized protein n=1 Tax=Sporolactobacillus shoreicorticis TaxID=1923877 RepID=A0ABW5S849_9BACL|nr:hypothetical protein [Sporolactobacillus shoreicorticis]MCO7126054.1 hypothetical protein [Sporolactobacillus shoreicorticis]